MKDNVSHVHIHELEMKWLTEGSKSVFCCFVLEVNADKSKYMVMSRDQNVGRSHTIKMDNSSFGRVDVFKYLETRLANQNFIQEEIKRRLKSRIACYHLVQNLLSSSLLSSNVKIRYTKL
jgi:hypothetical protein